VGSIPGLGTARISLVAKYGYLVRAAPICWQNFGSKHKAGDIVAEGVYYAWQSSN